MHNQNRPNNAGQRLLKHVQRVTSLSVLFGKQSEQNTHPTPPQSNPIARFHNTESVDATQRFSVSPLASQPSTPISQSQSFPHTHPASPVQRTASDHAQPSSSQTHQPIQYTASPASQPSVIQQSPTTQHNATLNPPTFNQPTTQSPTVHRSVNPTPSAPNNFIQQSTNISPEASQTPFKPVEQNVQRTLENTAVNPSNPPHLTSNPSQHSPISPPPSAGIQRNPENTAVAPNIESHLSNTTSEIAQSSTSQPSDVQRATETSSPHPDSAVMNPNVQKFMAMSSGPTQTNLPWSRLQAVSQLHRKDSEESPVEQETEMPWERNKRLKAEALNQPQRKVVRRSALEEVTPGKKKKKTAPTVQKAASKEKTAPNLQDKSVSKSSIIHSETGSNPSLDAQPNSTPNQSIQRSSDESTNGGSPEQDATNELSRPLQEMWPVQRLESPANIPASTDSESSAFDPPLLTPPPPEKPSASAQLARQLVQQVGSEKQSDSSIDYVMPTRPRPQIRRKKSNHNRRAQSNSAAESPTNSPSFESSTDTQVPAEQSNPIQRSQGQVQTEIGSLPGDLWELVGDTPPNSQDTSQTNRVSRSQNQEPPNYSSSYNAQTPSGNSANSFPVNRQTGEHIANQQTSEVQRFESSTFENNTAVTPPSQTFQQQPATQLNRTHSSVEQPLSNTYSTQSSAPVQRQIETTDVSFNLETAQPTYNPSPSQPTGNPSGQPHQPPIQRSAQNTAVSPESPSLSQPVSNSPLQMPIARQQLTQSASSFNRSADLDTVQTTKTYSNANPSHIQRVGEDTADKSNASTSEPTQPTQSFNQSSTVQRDPFDTPATDSGDFQEEIGFDPTQIEDSTTVESPQDEEIDPTSQVTPADFATAESVEAQPQEMEEGLIAFATEEQVEGSASPILINRHGVNEEIPLYADSDTLDQLLTVSGTTQEESETIPLHSTIEAAEESGDAPVEVMIQPEDEPETAVAYADQEQLDDILTQAETHDQDGVLPMYADEDTASAKAGDVTQIQLHRDGDENSYLVFVNADRLEDFLSEAEAEEEEDKLTIFATEEAIGDEIEHPSILLVQQQGEREKYLVFADPDQLENFLAQAEMDEKGPSLVAYAEEEGAEADLESPIPVIMKRLDGDEICIAHIDEDEHAEFLEAAEQYDSNLLIEEVSQFVYTGLKRRLKIERERLGQ